MGFKGHEEVCCVEETHDKQVHGYRKFGYAKLSHGVPNIERLFSQLRGSEIAKKFMDHNKVDSLLQTYKNKLQTTKLGFFERLDVDHRLSVSHGDDADYPFHMSL